MRKTNKILLTVLIVAVLLLGIGYAAIQNITLNITGTASADPSQTNFKVMFSGTPVVSDPTYVTTSITDETNATINVEGLTKKGDTATVTYTVQNTSVDLSADLSVSTTNSNSEYFTLTSELGKSSLVAGEATSLTITVELTKTPITESVSAVIGVQLEIMPVQPGEEGTSEGTNDFSQSPDYRNEFGFYFDKAYTGNVDGQDVAVVLKEDTSCDMYMDDSLYQKIPAGVIKYDSFSIDVSELGFGILTVASNGRQINGEGLVLELDEKFLETLPKGTYLTYNADTETYAVCEEMPSEVREGDIFICGDYCYNFRQYVNGGVDTEGWRVTLFSTEYSSYLSEVLGIEFEGQGIDKYQTSYDPILKRINGKPLICLESTFSGCTELTTVPEIPDTVIDLDRTFSGCTSLEVAPEIPEGVISIDEAFSGCTSLTVAPDFPNTLATMFGTFYGCTSLTTVPEIPDNVWHLRYTFSECTSLVTAPKLPVGNWENTFYGCTSLTTVPEIPYGIEELNGTFSGCTSLEVAPKIPESVDSLSGTFFGCTSLTTAPAIPSGVKNMDSTFYGCTSLEVAPEIPDSVETLIDTFRECTSLVGVIVINIDGEIQACGGCFTDVDMSKITLTGAASKEILNLLGSTGKNYTPIP